MSKRTVISSRKFAKSFDNILIKYSASASSILNDFNELHDYFANGGIIPSKFKNHKVGNYWECHLCGRNSNILLVYDKYKNKQDETVIELLYLTDHDKLNRQIRSSLIDLDSLEQYLNELSDSEFEYVVSIIERRLKVKRLGVL